MESLQPREEDLHPLAGGERVLEVRGEYLPLVELWKVFDVDGAKTEATQGIVVILQSADAVTRCWSISSSVSTRWWSKIWKAIIARYRGFPPRRSWATAASR
ncbi:chemotaxis protein CheA [Salmonella enterica subsp. enterica]|uniref:Chemotaxis protein CheA n=1 Tax=Salmonella enterica I TaxID=59201 RepID=A0A379W8B0_SALET|nr:chemotaxis protein CheA [Salmonella enterica subsp. enterica]